MFVFVASVHHNGTQFTQKLFEDLGYEITDKTPKEVVKRINGFNFFHRCHITDSVKTELTQWLNLGLPVIVPLRHPVAVAHSWLARGKPLDEMARQYELLFELVVPKWPRYLPIDHAERDLYFNEIKQVEPKLTTDWPIIGSKVVGSDHVAQLQPKTLSTADRVILMDLMDEPLFKRFYPAPWRM